MSSPIHSHIASFTNASGLKLYAEWWTPQRPSAVFVVAHGINEHSGRYGPFIQHFMKRGFAVAIYDQRGHGKSDGARGQFNRLQDFVSDLHEFIAVTKARYPDLPLFIVGHSFGGQVAVNYAVRHAKGIAGLILSSPNIGLKMKIPFWKQWCINKLCDRYPDMRIKKEINPKWLSHDQGVVERYRNDPRIVRHITLSGAREIFRNLEVMMAFASRLHVPCLLMHAGDDRVCCPDISEQFFKRIPVTQKKFVRFDGMYHELFNEVEREQVFRQLESWVDDCLCPATESQAYVAETPPTHYPSTPAAKGEVWGESW